MPNATPTYLLEPLLLFVLLFTISTTARADDTLIPPLKAIEQFGRVSIDDGSSYYTFTKDGSFDSGPLGLSGRTMKGKWKRDADGRFVVTAELGWMNGISQRDHWRRIVFFISHVTRRPASAKMRFGAQPETFDSYFFIDEMTGIPKPQEDLQK